MNFSTIFQDFYEFSNLLDEFIPVVASPLGKLDFTHVKTVFEVIMSSEDNDQERLQSLSNRTTEQDLAQTTDLTELMSTANKPYVKFLEIKFFLLNCERVVVCFY